MKKVLIAALLFVGLAIVAVAYVGFRMLTAGGFTGAGGVTEIIPDEARAGSPITVGLRFAVWGYGGGIKGRYENVLLYYRLIEKPEYQALRPDNVVHQDEKHELHWFVLPLSERNDRRDRVLFRVYVRRV